MAGLKTLYVDSQSFGYIQTDTKDMEALPWGMVDGLEAGDTVEFSEKKGSRSCRARVKSVWRYRKFSEAFNEHDYRRFLPDATGMAQAVYEMSRAHPPRTRKKGICVFEFELV